MFGYLISFMMVMSGEDWFLIWLGLEINMMMFLVLIYRRVSIGSIECCLKYFFIQGLGSVLFISFFFMNIYENMGIMVMILSLKIGAGPFFYWFPSMCSGLGWFSCYMLMLFQKILPLFLVTLFVHWIMWMVLSISLVMGVLGSFNQSNIKQLLAYSSVHHLGWIMMIMVKGSVNWMLYLMMYGFMLVSVVLILVKNEVVDMTMMYLSSGKLWFGMGMLSMGGMPPLLGFFLKWMALLYIMDMMVLVLLLVGASVIMLYVYMRLMYDMMMMGGIKSSWVDINSGLMMVNYDILSVIGLLLGTLVGFILVM